MIRKLKIRRTALLIGMVLAAIAVFAAIRRGADPEWRRLDGVLLAQSRRGLTMLPLPDGRVLIAGGRTTIEGKSELPDVKSYNSEPVKVCEIYDPNANTCTPAGAFISPWGQDRFCTLNDGRILAIGGGPEYPCELYNPVTGKWSLTGDLRRKHHDSPAVVLAGGEVLIAGGHEDGEAHAACELYDPARGSWTAAGSLPRPMSWHHLVALPDGSALAIAGDGKECLRYNPKRNRWTAAAPTHNEHGSSAIAVVLKTGRVLIAGGMRWAGGDHPNPAPSMSSEVYDPGKNEWKGAADVPVPIRGRLLTKHLLDNGKVLLISADTERSCLLYHPRTDRWEKIPMPHTPRFDHGAATLADGRVLIAGGYKGGVDTSSVLRDFEILEWK